MPDEGQKSKSGKVVKIKKLSPVHYLSGLENIENTHNIIDLDIFLLIAAVCMWFH